MIRLSCPDCDKKLVVKPELEGRTVICPACKGRIQVPVSAAIQETEPPPPPPEYDDRPARRGADDDFDDDYDDDPRPRRRKKKKRRRSSSGLSLDNGNLIMYVLIALPIVVLAGLGVAAAVPTVAPLVAWLGRCITLVGAGWVLVVAFSEDSTQGVLCLCVPCYAFYYVASHFEETKIPAAIWLGGVILQFGTLFIIGVPGWQRM